MTYKGKVRDKVIELEGAVALPEGMEVEIVVKDGPREKQTLRDHPRSSPQAIAKFLDSPPVCSPEDVEALVQAIEQGKRPVKFEGIFDKV